MRYLWSYPSLSDIPPIANVLLLEPQTNNKHFKLFRRHQRYLILGAFYVIIKEKFYGVIYVANLRMAR